MPTVKQIEELRQGISAAFPSQRFFGAVTNGCNCEECGELERSLHLQSWAAISDETMDAQFGSLPLLSDEAFRAFLPAWLMRSLDEPNACEQKFREWTLYSLALYYDDEDDKTEIAAKTEHLRRRLDTLTHEQVCVVAEWLLFLRDHAHISDWGRESIDRALHLLNSIGGPPPN